MEQYSALKENGMYQNPILFGDFADPSILKDGDDYYLVNSLCGHHQRIMPMWHSKDLLNWEILYNVFDDCFFPEKNRVMNSAWAPELIKHKDIYYIYNYTPQFGVWVTTCKDIKVGNWSDPVAFPAIKNAIDPGHVTDDVGNRYLCVSRNIMFKLSEDGLKTVSDGVKICEDWQIPEEYDIEGICTESPKFFKKNGYIYLLTAQGGTVGPPTSHCAVAYRAKHPLGPYEMSPYNPIIHTDSKSHGWWSTGHGSLVDGMDGKTYIFYHGIKNAHRYIGRQCLMMPVEWTNDGWFKVAKNDDESQIAPTDIKKDLPLKISLKPSDKQFGFLYNFDSKNVSNRVKFNDDSIIYQCEDKDIWNTEAITITEQSYHYEYSVTVKMPKEKEVFGIGTRFSPTINCGITIQNNHVILFKHGKNEWLQEKVEVKADIITLKMICNHGTISYFYKCDDGKFIKLPHAYDMADCSSNIAKGFSGVKTCLWASGKGEISILEVGYKNI